jgi:hypothetical protein
VNTAIAGGSRLVACLARIQSLLEKGEVTEAAALVGELNAAMAGGPEPMTESELEEARQSLLRCGELERALRRSALQALQHLGATRRSQAYRTP